MDGELLVFTANPKTDENLAMFAACARRTYSLMIVLSGRLKSLQAMEAK
jgi:hypothetical protein